jgi:HlyD family secretion protein
MKNMKKKVVIAVVLVATLIAATLIWQHVAQARETPTFRFTTVERGNLQSVVSSTGTLNAVTTVSVGTQVSGQVAELLVDYNDHVKKGQLLARIDPTLQQQAVADAQANLQKVQAQANQSSRDQYRNRELAGAGLIARSALEQGGSALQVAQADVRSAEIALQRAKQNLSYTNIYAPIDGVIVERNVNNGQTVAASLSAPQLFLIANDLSRMQILAQVSESDIEQIKEGQQAKFTVQALPGQTFTGTVQQVRLQSTTADNVVNYTVVVMVENPGEKLLPGMTARVDFLVKDAAGVLKVSNAALRYKPTDEVLAAYGATKDKTTTAATGSTATSSSSGAQGGGAQGGGAASGRGGAGRARSGQSRAPGSGGFGTLYYLDADSKLQKLRVHTGITDGTTTQVEGKGLSEGMKVIAGTISAQTAGSTTTAATPFQGGQQQRGAAGGAGGRPPAPGGF